MEVLEPMRCLPCSSEVVHSQHTGLGPVASVVTASISVLCQFSPCSCLSKASLSLEVHASANIHLPASFLQSCANPPCSLPLWVDAIPVWCATSLQFVWAQALHHVLL